MAAGATSSSLNLGAAGLMLLVTAAVKKICGEDDHRGIKIIKQLN
jgi:hypothetical protein